MTVEMHIYVMDQISDKKIKKRTGLRNWHFRQRWNIWEREKKYIIRLRFFEGRTQMEVAEDIDISQAQVSRLEKHALKVMRQYLMA